MQSQSIGGKLTHLRMMEAMAKMGARSVSMTFHRQNKKEFRMNTQSFNNQGEALCLDTKEVWTCAETCTYLGLQPRGLYKMTHLRKIPHYKKGKLLFFKRSEIIAWLLQCRVSTTDELEQRASEMEKGGEA